MDEAASAELPWVDSTFRHFIKGWWKRLKVLNAGPLEVSKMVEPITPLILNVKLFGLKETSQSNLSDNLPNHFPPDSAKAKRYFYLLQKLGKIRRQVS
jgi:hypothetical protein